MQAYLNNLLQAPATADDWRRAFRRVFVPMAVFWLISILSGFFFWASVPEPCRAIMLCVTGLHPIWWRVGSLVWLVGLWAVPQAHFPNKALRKLLFTGLLGAFLASEVLLLFPMLWQDTTARLTNGLFHVAVFSVFVLIPSFNFREGGQAINSKTIYQLLLALLISTSIQFGIDWGDPWESRFFTLNTRILLPAIYLVCLLAWEKTAQPLNRAHLIWGVVSFLPNFFVALY